MGRYMRTLPRDLFNEASLLKCLGHLWIQLDETHGHGARFVTETVADFDVVQEESSGGIRAAGVIFAVGDRTYELTRPLNSRAAWPLYVEGGDDDPDFDPVAVFDDEGRLSPDMLALIGVTAA